MAPRRFLGWRGAAIVAIFATGAATYGCDKKTNSTSDAVVAAPKSAPSSGASVETAKGDGKKKLAKKKPEGAKVVGKKGGEDGSAGKPIPASAIKAPDDVTTSLSKKIVESAPKDACAEALEHAAICAGDELRFCNGKELWAVDCDAFARSAGFSGGSCFETEAIGASEGTVDCFGLTPSEAGHDVFCDPDANVCCEADGACWADADGGDDNK
jgi:hypothetical protein